MKELVNSHLSKKSNVFLLDFCNFISTSFSPLPPSFDMRVQNKIDRYHLVMDALKHLNYLENRGSFLYQECLNKLVEHKEHIREYGTDMDVITKWKWHDINKRSCEEVI